MELGKARVTEEARCSFCEVLRSEVFKLIAGPGVFVCDRCVGRSRVIAEGTLPGEVTPPFFLQLHIGGRAHSDGASSAKRNEPGCSFCDRQHEDVRYVIVGPRARMCDDCIGLSEDIVKQARDLSSDASVGEDADP